ncbi:MAG: glycosyltransferase [Bacteroidales bacterium]|nr:glycosyltransferase [Bacteroidales bacterium]
MRILIVSSFNKGRISPFVVEQAEALRKEGCEIDYFGLQGKGMHGYLKNLPSLQQRINVFHPDVVHAHYGLSGLLANLQRKVPVVTTYHGSDINDRKVLPFSRMAMRLSAWNIFVSRKTMEIASPKRKFTLLPCGVDMSDLQLTEKNDARRKMNLDANKRYVLFAGSFDNAVKNASLAKETIELLNDENVELLELKGYSRDEVTLLMCAADAFLLTSISEGSPQVVKEAMVCGCPIVSVDVGDVRERVEEVAGCFVSSIRNAQELSALLRKAITYGGKTSGREKLIADRLDNKLVAQQLNGIYDRVLKYENY